MVKQGPPKIHPATKIMRKLAKAVNINFFRTLKLTKDLQQSEEHLFKRNSQCGREQ